MVQKSRRLEREVHSYLEREKRHLAAHQREMSKAADMNAKLQQQLAEKDTEIRTFAKEV